MKWKQTYECLKQESSRAWMQNKKEKKKEKHDECKEVNVWTGATELKQELHKRPPK